MKWFRYLLILLVTIFRFSFAYSPTTPTTSELRVLIYPALHCLYCTTWQYPHGWLWYIIMFPFFYFSNVTVGLIAVATVDLVIFNLLLNSPAYKFWPYFILSSITYFAVFQNMPILWLELLSFESPYLLPLPIFAKLPNPIGPGSADWYFILHSSLNIASNYEKDYSYIVFFWIYVLCYHLRVPLRNGVFRILEYFNCL